MNESERSRGKGDDVAGEAAEQTAPYERIADFFRKKIEAGELLPAAKLPTVDQIVEEWSVSRATVNKAIAELRAEGLVQTSGRGGTIVQEKDVESVLAIDLGFGVEVFSTGVVQVSGAAARQLKVADGSSVLVVRVRHRGDSNLA